MADIFEPAPQQSRLGQNADPELKECETEINSTTKGMSDVRAEYYVNVCRLRDGYRPKVYPYLHSIHMNQFYLASMRMEADWLERKHRAMLAAPHGRFLEQRDMAAAKKELFQPLQEAFALAFREMGEVPKHELALLRGYENPPPLVADTVRTIMQVRGDDDLSWEAAKIIFAETYYYAFFASRCKSQIRSEVLTEDGGVMMASLEKYLLNPESTVDRVANVSPPCAPMARFLHTLYLFVKATEITQQQQQQQAGVDGSSTSSLGGVKDRLAEQRLKIQEREEDIRGAEEKVNALNEELRQREKDLAERYDVTMVPLQDLFFQAHDHFVTVYHQKSPIRSRRDNGENEL